MAPPLKSSNYFVASIVQEIGPLFKISFFIFEAPFMELNYSA